MLPNLPFDPRHVLIGGAWRATVATLQLINPSDGSTLCQIARSTETDVDAAVITAQTALDGAWGRMSALERGRCLTRLGELVLKLSLIHI